MLIGELAERAGTSARLVRYYESQELLTSRRLANGYRDYDESAVARVRQIRALLGCGLPTRIAKQVLPRLEDAGDFVPATADAELLAVLHAERAAVADRAAALARDEVHIARYIAAAEGVTPDR